MDTVDQLVMSLLMDRIAARQDRMLDDQVVSRKRYEDMSESERARCLFLAEKRLGELRRQAAEIQAREDRSPSGLPRPQNPPFSREHQRSDRSAREWYPQVAPSQKYIQDPETGQYYLVEKIYHEDGTYEYQHVPLVRRRVGRRIAWVEDRGDFD